MYLETSGSRISATAGVFHRPRPRTLFIILPHLNRQRSQQKLTGRSYTRASDMDGKLNSCCAIPIDPHPKARTVISPAAVFRYVASALASLKAKPAVLPPKQPPLSYYYTPSRERQIKEYQDQIKLGAPPPKSSGLKDSTFTLFPLLPTELRVKIWKSFLESPQIIDFQYFNSLQPVVLDQNPFARHRNGASLMLVNKEAHYEAAKMVYASHDNALIDWKFDILHLESPDDMKSFKTLVERKTFRDPDRCPRKLALNLMFEGAGPNVTWKGLEADLWILSQLFVLERVIFVVRPIHENGGQLRPQQLSQLCPEDFDPSDLHAVLERLFDRWVERSSRSGPLRWQKPKITFVRAPGR